MTQILPSLEYLSILTLIIICVGQFINAENSKYVSKAFIISCLVCILALLVDAITYNIYNYDVHHPLFIVFSTMSFAIGSWIFIPMGYYVYNKFSETCKINKWFFHSISIVVGISTIDILYLGFSGQLINIYYGSQPVSALSLLPVAIIILGCLYFQILAIWKRKYIGTKTVITFIIYGILPIFSIIYEVLTSAKYSFSLIATALSLQIVNIVLQKDTIRLHQKEIVSQQKQIDEDALTGLYSRNAFNEYLHNIKKTGYLDEDLVIFSIDINGLKTINDTLGHLAGDELLIAAAKSIQKIISPYGKCFRIGGDEFIAVINSTNKDAEQISEQIKHEASLYKGELISNIKMAIGFSCKNEHKNSNIEELINFADKNMYHDKSNFYKESSK